MCNEQVQLGKLFNNNIYLGSAWCVGKNKALTAKHVVCEANNPLPLDGIRILFGQTSLKVKEILQHKDKDVAILTLEIQDHATNNLPFEILPLYSIPRGIHCNYSVVGFPSVERINDDPFICYCELRQVFGFDVLRCDDFGNHNPAVLKGMSGGVLVATIDDSTYVIGLFIKNRPFFPLYVEAIRAEWIAKEFKLAIQPIPAADRSSTGAITISDHKSLRMISDNILNSGKLYCPLSIFSVDASSSRGHYFDLPMDVDDRNPRFLDTARILLSAWLPDLTDLMGTAFRSNKIRLSGHVKLWRFMKRRRSGRAQAFLLQSDIGYGKTTLLLAMAQHLSLVWYGRFGIMAWFPIVVKASDAYTNLLDEKSVEKFWPPADGSVASAPSLFKRLIMQGKAFIIIDSLEDLARPNEKRELWEKLLKLVTMHNGNRLIVATRLNDPFEISSGMFESVQTIRLPPLVREVQDRFWNWLNTVGQKKNEPLPHTGEDGSHGETPLDLFLMWSANQSKVSSFQIFQGYTQQVLHGLQPEPMAMLDAWAYQRQVDRTPASQSSPLDLSAFSTGMRRGFFFEESEEDCRFLHGQFQYFFAARHILQKKVQPSDNWVNNAEQWRHVFRFIAMAPTAEHNGFFMTLVESLLRHRKSEYWWKLSLEVVIDALTKVPTEKQSTLIPSWTLLDPLLHVESPAGKCCACFNPSSSPASSAIRWLFALAVRNALPIPSWQRDLECLIEQGARMSQADWDSWLQRATRLPDWRMRLQSSRCDFSRVLPQVPPHLRGGFLWCWWPTECDNETWSLLLAGEMDSDPCMILGLLSLIQERLDQSKVCVALDRLAGSRDTGLVANNAQRLLCLLQPWTKQVREYAAHADLKRNTIIGGGAPTERIATVMLYFQEVTTFDWGNLISRLSSLAVTDFWVENGHLHPKYAVMLGAILTRQVRPVRSVPWMPGTFGKQAVQEWLWRGWTAWEAGQQEALGTLPRAVQMATDKTGEPSPLGSTPGESDEAELLRRLTHHVTVSDVQGVVDTLDDYLAIKASVRRKGPSNGPWAQWRSTFPLPGARDQAGVGLPP